MFFVCDLVVLRDGSEALVRWDGNGGLHQKGPRSFVLAVT